MRVPAFLILAPLCLFGSLAFAQNPEDFLDRKKAKSLTDSLYESSTKLPRDKVLYLIKDYYRKQADAYHQAFILRTNQLNSRIASNRLGNSRLQENSVTQLEQLFNSATEEGQVPDSIEYEALKALYEATGGSNWTYDNYWLQINSTVNFAWWYGVQVEDGDVVSISLWENNMVGNIPPEIKNLTSLRSIQFDYNQIEKLPVEIGYLNNLVSIDLPYNKITELPEEIGNLSNLETLVVDENLLKSLPKEIGNLSKLELLSLARNQVSSLPSEIGNLTNLQVLSVYGNQLSDLPPEIGRLSSLWHLSLSNNQITDLPAEIENLSNLIELLFRENRLNTLPPEIKHLSSLVSLSCDYNRIDNIPSWVKQLPELSQLSVGGNRININNIAQYFTEQGPIFKSYFGYRPQDEVIGEMKNLSSEQGETVSLQAFTNNHPQTRFQWYHMEDGNWTEIPDQVSESYIIPIVLLIDSGQYRCRITNDWVSRLTQYSAPITLEVTENPNNEGELSDSLEIEALTAFYNATKGGSWNSNTNWLQGTTVDEVANWHGITIENGDVATIQLANNNLSGSLPLKINDLLGLTQLDIRNNAFSVNAIANYFTGPDTYPVDELLYQPQAEVIGQSTTLDVSAGDPVVLRAFTNNHPQTRFQWFRNEEGAWVEIVGQTNESLTLASVTTAEAGQYRCQITNEWVSGLKQYSAPITLNVEEPIAIDEGLVPDSLEYAALVAIYYATQGEEWLHNDNWLQGSTSADFDTWWGVEVTDGDIDSLILSGNNLNGSIPADIDDLTQLAALTLSDNNIPGISAEIARLVNLTYLDLHAVGLDNLPNAVSNLSSLKSLNLAENNLTQLPGGIKNLSLEQLDVSSNELATLPNFNDHPTLNDLIVSANRISVNDIAFNRDGPGVADHDFTSFGYTPQAEVIGSPRNQFVVEGQNISLQAFTNNHPQSRFQWYRQQGNTWTALSGQTQATYTITSVTTDHAGQYRCQITNNWVDGITQYSAPITLEITNGPYYSVASGLWTDAIWALEPGGAPVGTYPQAYSEAYIVGHDVTVNQPLTTGSVHVVVDRAPSSLTVDGAEMVIRGQLDLTKKTEGFPGNVKVVNDGRIVPLQP